MIWNCDQISPDQIDLTLSYFADDAIFTMVGFPPTMPSEFRRQEAIRAAYESWIPPHPKLEVRFEAVEGDTVTATTSYWSDPMSAMKVAPLVGAEVYVFVVGKIAGETKLILITGAMSLDNNTGRYRAFLLRMWVVEQSGQIVWRASLESAQNGEVGRNLDLLEEQGCDTMQVGSVTNCVGPTAWFTGLQSVRAARGPTSDCRPTTRFARGA